MGTTKRADPDEVLTPEQAGEVLQVSARTVVALCARGDLVGARKFGRRWRIPRWAIDRYFDPDGSLNPKAEASADVAAFVSAPVERGPHRVTKLVESGAPVVPGKTARRMGVGSTQS